MGNITQSERNLAFAMAKDTASLEVVGVREAAKIGFAMQREVQNSNGKSTTPIISKVRLIRPTLVDAMLYAYLLGKWRIVTTAQQQGLSLSIYSDAISNLEARLKLSPEEIKQLREKFDTKAVSVLHTVEASVDKKLQTAILEATKNQAHVAEGKKLLGQAFVSAGIVPSNSFQLEAIFRTQTQMAYAAGSWMQEQDPDIQEILWGYKYVTVGDDRVRPEHAALEGTTAPKDHPIWQKIYPPNGWGCRCKAIPILKQMPVKLPPETVVIDGQTIKPGADKGFGFNPGELYKDILKVTETTTAPPLPKVPIPPVIPTGGTITKALDTPVPQGPPPPQPAVSTIEPAVPKPAPKPSDLSNWTNVKPKNQTPAKVEESYKEIRRTFKSKYNINLLYDDKGKGKISNYVVNSANKAGSAMADLFTRFEGLDNIFAQAMKHDSLKFRELLMVDVKFVNPAHKSMGSYYPGMRRIRMGARYESPNHSLTVGKKFLVAEDYASSFRHEFGHWFDEVGRDIMEEVLSIPRNERWTAVYNEVGGSDWFKTNVSTYAEVNKGEAFAECFSAFTHPEYSNLSAKKRLPAKLHNYFKKILQRRELSSL